MLIIIYFLKNKKIYFYTCTLVSMAHNIYYPNAFEIIFIIENASYNVIALTILIIVVNLCTLSSTLKKLEKFYIVTRIEILDIDEI